MDMNWKKIAMSFLLAAGLPLARNAQAQTTYEEMEQLTVNEQITTVITASEPVRFVDISTDKVAWARSIEVFDIDEMYSVPEEYRNFTEE